jgi:uncharacterized protein with PIN domain
VKVTLYLYHNVMGPLEMYLKRCEKCNRPLFKYNAKELVISNFGPSDFDVYPPNAKLIEIQCHSCQTKYNVQFL